MEREVTDLILSKFVLIDGARIFFTSENQTLFSHEEVQLICTAIGFPVPSITWRNAKEMILRDNYTSETTKGHNSSSTLTLNSDMFNNSFNIFTCTANNSINSSISYFTLTIQCKYTMGILTNLAFKFFIYLYIFSYGLCYLFVKEHYNNGTVKIPVTYCSNTVNSIC